MSFTIKELKGGRIKVEKSKEVEEQPVECHYAVTGGKIKISTLKSMIINGYIKKPQGMDNINSYVLDKSLSGTRAQVYHHPETNHLVVNHRGTQGIHDVITDMRLMLGDKSN